MIGRFAVVAALSLAAAFSFAQKKVPRLPRNIVKVPVIRQRVVEKPSLPAALIQLIDKASTRRFSGIRTVEYRAGNKLERHEEIVLRSGGRARVEFPTNSPYSGQIIVEDEKERLHYFPDRNEIRVLPPRREEIMERIGNLAQVRAGNIAVSNSEPVAGVRTEPLIVMDKQGHVLQRLWIEPRSGALLKRQIFDRAGDQVGSFEYTQVDFSPRIDDKSFVIDRPGAKVITQLVLLRRLVTRLKMDLLAIPPSSGYRLEGSHSVNVDGKTIVVQNYLSGANRITLFQVQGVVDLDPKKLSQQARGDFANTTWRIGDNTLVLIGAVDSATLSRLAASVGPGTGTGRN